MIPVTLDASVLCKWFLKGAGDDEDHIAQADALAHAVGDGRVELIEPPHWLAEVVAVLVRRRPHAAAAALRHLTALAPRELRSARTYRTAARLATESGAHLFDTLYHAVALEVRGTLVTADLRYLRMAPAGRVVALADWPP